jgi:prepilin-type N-terminal cleavage/methylation domain-containing protein
MSMSTAARSGLSLLELLLVMTILAILVGITLPSLARARTQVRITKCAANLSQLATTLHAYSDEYEGRLPCQAVGLQDWSGTLFENYGTPPALFRCPDDFSPRRRDIADPWSRSYAVNNALSTYALQGFRAPWPAQRTAVAERIFRVPPAVFLIGENHNGGYVSAAVVGIAEAECMGASSSAVHRTGSSNEGANYAFADQHVEYISHADMTRWIPMRGGPSDPWKWSE